MEPPNGPKRPLSPFMLWLNANREEIKYANPHLKVTEIAKLAGKIWRSMTDKSEWIKKSAQAKHAYEAAMKEYKQKYGERAAAEQRRYRRRYRNVPRKTKRNYKAKAKTTRAARNKRSLKQKYKY